LMHTHRFIWFYVGAAGHPRPCRRRAGAARGWHAFGLSGAPMTGLRIACTALDRSRPGADGAALLRPTPRAPTLAARLACWSRWGPVAAGTACRAAAGRLRHCLGCLGIPLWCPRTQHAPGHRSFSRIRVRQAAHAGRPCWLQTWCPTLQQMFPDWWEFHTQSPHAVMRWATHMSIIRGPACSGWCSWQHCSTVSRWARPL